jgi:hypothetical protein
VLLGAVPVAVVGLAQPASSMRLARDNSAVNEAPLSSAFHLRATTGGGTVRLRWDSIATGSTRPLYQVYVSSAGDGCQRPARGSNECFLVMRTHALVSGTTIVDTLPRSGARWYRIGVLASYQQSQNGGDLMLLSQALRVAR